MNMRLYTHNNHLTELCLMRKRVEKDAEVGKEDEDGEKEKSEEHRKKELIKDRRIENKAQKKTKVEPNRIRDAADQRKVIVEAWQIEAQRSQREQIRREAEAWRKAGEEARKKIEVNKREKEEARRKKRAERKERKEAEKQVKIINAALKIANIAD